MISSRPAAVSFSSRPVILFSMTLTAVEFSPPTQTATRCMSVNGPLGLTGRYGLLERGFVWIGGNG